MGLLDRQFDVLAPWSCASTMQLSAYSQRLGRWLYPRRLRNWFEVVIGLLGQLVAHHLHERSISWLRCIWRRCCEANVELYQDLSRLNDTFVRGRLHSRVESRRWGRLLSIGLAKRVLILLLLSGATVPQLLDQLPQLIQVCQLGAQHEPWPGELEPPNIWRFGLARWPGWPVWLAYVHMPDTYRRLFEFPAQSLNDPSTFQCQKVELRCRS